MLNKSIICGRMVFDPELRSTTNNTPVMSVRLACERDKKNENGERHTDWLDVVLWRSTAEYVNRFGSKGRILLVVGQLHSRDWTDKTGAKRTSIEVEAENVYFMDNKKTADFENLQNKFEELNDDIPF